MMTLDGSYYEELTKLNTVPFGFSVDSPDTQADASGDLKNVLMISDHDPKGEVSEILGIYDNGRYSTRANLVIDEEGLLQYKQEYALSSMPDFEEVVDAIEGM